MTRLPFQQLFSTPPPSHAKGSIPMISMRGGSPSTVAEEHSRPKGRIVGKHGIADRCSSISCIDGGLVVGFRQKYLTDGLVTLLLRLPGFDQAEAVIGIGDETEISQGGRYILGRAAGVDGTLFRGGSGIATVSPVRIEARVPVCGPAAWRNVARQEGADLVVGVWDWFRPPTVDAEDFYLIPVLENRASGVSPLLRVDHRERKASLIVELALGTTDALTRIRTSRNGDTAYYATHRAVGAVNVESGQVEWRRELAGIQSDIHDVYGLKGLALSHDGRYLACGGITSAAHQDRSFVVLDVRGGDEVLRSGFPWQLATTGFRCKTSVSAIAWHRLGWVAVGTSAGVLVHMLLDGTWRAYRGSSREIGALAFIDDGRRLLVGSGEKHCGSGISCPTNTEWRTERRHPTLHGGASNPVIRARDRLGQAKPHPRCRSPVALLRLEHSSAAAFRALHLGQRQDRLLSLRGRHVVRCVARAIAAGEIPTGCDERREHPHVPA